MFASGNLPSDLSNSVMKMLSEFEKKFGEIVDKERLNKAVFPMFRNHNLFIGVDASNVHIVYTTEGVTSGIISSTELDLRNRGNLTREQIVSVCIRELGYKDIHYFGFSVGLFDADVESRDVAFESASREYIEERIRPLILLSRLGLNESFAYLQSAQSRFDTKTPSGYSECKTGCRNALISALKALSGTENVRKAVRMLGKKDVIGEREEELIESFEDFLAKLVGVLSKKGPHPPMPTEEEAEFALRMTYAVLDYLAKRVIKKTST